MHEELKRWSTGESAATYPLSCPGVTVLVPPVVRCLSVTTNERVSNDIRARDIDARLTGDEETDEVQLGQLMVEDDEYRNPLQGQVSSPGTG